MVLTGGIPNHVKKFISFLYFGVDKKRAFIYNTKVVRGVAQFGRALGSGPRGRRFKSSHSDQRQRPRKPSHKYLWLGLFLFYMYFT